MELINERVLTKAKKKHRDAAEQIDNWTDTAKDATWQSLADVQRYFASADGVPIKVKGIGVVVVTVFNIKGNEYRLITTIDYARRTIVIREFLTHAEYSKDQWKGRL